MAGKSRASFEKRSRERGRQKKREEKLQRRQDRRDAKGQREGGDDDPMLANQDIDMEGLFGPGGRGGEDVAEDQGETETET
jgi:hypothetical protein